MLILGDVQNYTTATATIMIVMWIILIAFAFFTRIKHIIETNSIV
jgi:hypothetical protein